MLRVLLAAALWVMLTWSALADERILSFDSLVDVQPDGDYLVTETIRVRAEGDQISRGIYRDFPILVSDGIRNMRVGFALIETTRDGQPEPNQIVEGAKAIRIYLGDPTRYIPAGEHVYRLSYRTDRQLRRFAGADEVYWNATGTEWLFPIDRATTTVTLPPGAQINELAGFTGAFGETETDVTWSQPDQRTVVFQSTRPLEPREGITVSVSFPTGIIPQPDRERQIEWLLRDHRAGLRALAGFLIVFLYYFAMWWFFGRDPARDVIVPRWEPPAGLTAALTRSTWKKKPLSENEALALTVVEMASRGVIAASGTGSSLVLSRLPGEAADDLPPEQRLVLQALDATTGELPISKANGSKIDQLRDAVSGSLNKQYRALASYRRYGWRAFGGMVLSLCLLVTISFQLPEKLNVITLALTLFLALALLFLAGGILGNEPRKGWIGAVFGIFMLSPFLGLLGLAYVTEGGELLMLLVLIGMVALNLVFVPILGGPTSAGRQRLDQIEGLREYIEVAEEDRLKLADAPGMSRIHFERILPFAMALDLEQVWVKRFRAWLADIGETASAKSDMLLAGGIRRDDDRLSLSRLYEGGSSGRPISMEKQLASSFTSALPIASSSSSGSSSGRSSSSSSRSSGGSSGGGGGGGGGGGW